MAGNTHGPEALSVLNLDENSYKINAEAFKSVLNKAGNAPICILSINGPTRTGKSYLLDHFVRYFENKKRNPNCSDWYKQETAATFGWRRGVNRMTVGINLWSEPYFVSTPDGGKLAVLLMDTQELFDKETTPRQNAIIFSISTLCSSVMMFNIMRFVDDNVLQQVEYFSGYAHMASAYQQKNQAENSSGSSNFMSGTKLFFLVRDFSLPDEEYMYGNHSEYEKPPESNGNYFLDTFELKSGCPETNKIVRQNIRRNFRDISIYCLPDPGNRFVRGKVSEPDEEFQEHVISFVENILRVENLVKKTVLGKPTTGLEFRQYIDTWADLCAHETGIFPDVVSVADSTAYTQYSMANNISMSKYKNDMEAFVFAKRESATDNELEAAHADFSKAAKVIFEKEHKMPHPRYERECKEKMEMEFKYCFEVAKKNIEIFKQAAAKAGENEELHKQLVQEIKNDMNNERARMDAIIRGFKDSNETMARNNKMLSDRLEATMKDHAIKMEASAKTAENQRVSLEKQIQELKLAREREAANASKAVFNTPTSSSAKWVSCSNGSLPSNAVLGGAENGDALYVARAYLNGILTPGKFQSRLRTCYVPWGGKEHKVNPYEILVANPGELRWSTYSNGMVGGNAVVGGRSETGDELFIGRFEYNGACTPGKIQPRHQKCYIPYGWKEISSSTYQVLHA